MKISTTLGSTATASVLLAGLIAVPAADAAPDAASARGAAIRTCAYDGPKNTRLKIKLRLPHSAKDRNDLHAVRVRATDMNGKGEFRNRSVRAGAITISVEHAVEHSGGGSLSSASAVRRHGSPATWRLNPRSSGANVERVVAEVTFKLRNGTKVRATCATNID